MTVNVPPSYSRGHNKIPVFKLKNYRRME